MLVCIFFLQNCRIKNRGTPGKGMISWKSQLTPNEIGELIKGTNPKNAKEAEGELR